MLIAALLWAQPEPMLLLATDGSSNQLLLNYGVLGVAALVLGRFALAAYARERDRADKLESLIFEKILPASTAMLEASADMLDYLRRAPK